MSQQLIARFVFNEGEPVDVSFSKDKKEEFISAIEKKQVYLDNTSEAAFWPNLNLVKCFFVMERPVNQEDPKPESNQDKE